MTWPNAHARTEPHSTDALARMVRDQIVRNSMAKRPSGRHHHRDDATTVDQLTERLADERFNPAPPHTEGARR